jgi:hypothetical protein
MISVQISAIVVCALTQQVHIKQLLNTSETIKDLEIQEGRRLLHEFFHERRVKNTFEFRTALECWRLCRNAVEVQFGDGRRVRFETNLGLKLGTRVFLEEIMSRYYYNAIQGLVYGCAALILISVALYLFGYSIWFALAAFLLEAVFLLFLSIATAYLPNEETISPYSMGLPEHLLVSINGSVREMTNAVSDLLRLFSQTDIRQDMLLTRLTEYISKVQSENTRLFISKLEETNTILRQSPGHTPPGDAFPQSPFDFEKR